MREEEYFNHAVTPDEERKQIGLGKVFFLASVVFSILIGSTFAANINLTNSGATEFGQGILTSTTCDSYIVVKPFATYDGTQFRLSSIEISDISTLNHDNSFTVQIYNETSSVGLLAEPAVIAVGSSGTTFTKTSTSDNSTLETVTINSTSPGGGSKNEIGTSVIRLTSITRDGSNPILASQGVKFTLQSSGNGNCSRVYAIGDVGPAGGTIGILPTTAGNSTGKYFEFGIASTSMPWCGSSDPGYSNVSGTGTAIGTGAANTALIVASCSSGPAVYADQYSLNGYNDWFLTSAYELNAIKDVAPSGGYATSSQRGAGSIYYQNIPNGQPVLNDHAGTWFPLAGIPIRSFNP